MGGSVAKTVGNVVGTGLSLGLNKIGGPDNPARRFGNFAGSVFTGGTSGQGWGATRTDANGRPLVGGSDSPYVSGPFTLDPEQLAADQADIAALGTSQDAQNQQFITQDAAERDATRQKLGQSLQTQASESFRRMLPETEETLNAQHLLNGSGLGQELSRQQGYLATDIANQVGTQGVLDLNRTSDQRAAALQALQGYGQAGLGRKLSLEDFINQANVAKTIGATMAPQVSNGKTSTGTLLSGVGSLAPLAGTVIGGMYGQPALGKAAGSAVKQGLAPSNDASAGMGA